MIKRKIIPPEKALIRLEELCARAEHCTFELSQKLRGWGIAADDADAIIQSLKRRRFVDDARFAASFVRDRYKYGRCGRNRIRLLLMSKHIDSDTIEEALAEIDDDEYRAILQRIIDVKKQSTPEASSYQGRNKIFRYALSRGYESNLIADVLKS